MKTITITLLLSISIFYLHAQVADNFNDGNFSSNPLWMGDDSLFTVQNSQLRLTGTMASDAHLVTPNVLIDSATWVFYSRFNLNPSSQNFSRFYVMSDTPNLEGPLNGYYVQLGGSTGNTDSISLFRQNGLIRTRIIAGRAGTLGKANNQIRVKVFRDRKGNWQLYSDTTGAYQWILEGQALDSNVKTTRFIGWYIRFSSGNSQNHFLDDVEVYTNKRDTIPPKIDSLLVLGNNRLVIYFNEALNQTTATQLNAYQILPDAGVFSVSLLSPAIVLLTFQNPFVSKQTYRIRIDGIRDSANQLMLLYDTTFLFYSPQLHDLLISELFPDPTPAVGIPEHEFIELYNPNEVALSLNRFTISDGTTTVSLPPFLLSPKQFVILCQAANAVYFQPFGSVVGLNTFPSLNNSADVITIADVNGNIIHQVPYDLSWYQSLVESAGGYTIELHYPTQLCKSKYAYAASNAAIGGTPGAINSIWDFKPDSTAPFIIQKQILSPVTIKLTTNEPLLISGLPEVTVIGRSQLFSVELINEMEILITLTDSLQSGVNYTLQLNQLRDCSYNDTSLQFIVVYYKPEAASNFDVLINEIMADPNPVQSLPDAEYIELYNRSQKVVNLEQWQLSDKTSSAKLPGFILLPDSFVLITSTASASLFNGITVLGISNFPSLGNEEDQITLSDKQGRIIHAITYNQQSYRDAFKQEGGFSLEMMDTRNPCLPENWLASIHPTGGTPARVNSVKRVFADQKSPELQQVFPINQQLLRLTFDEPLDTFLTFKQMKLMLNGNEKTFNASGVVPMYTDIMLALPDTLSRNQVYQLKLDSVKDCAGNTSTLINPVTFAFPEPIVESGIIINELLFNPASGGVDFVEIYNPTDKYINLAHVGVATRDENGILKDVMMIAPNGRLLPPQTYLVLCSNVKLLQSQYYCRYPEHLIDVSLPSFPDDKGCVVILNQQGKILEEFNYTKDMHSSWIDDDNGVSLERIQWQKPASNVTNWLSASASVGYATPTYQNSQYINYNTYAQLLQVHPQTISPDGDGYHDVMEISYKLDMLDCLGSMSIYNSSGIEVKKMMKGELLGFSGSIFWDGTNNNDNLVPPGIYLIHFTITTTNGEVKEIKKIAVVAAKL